MLIDTEESQMINMMLEYALPTLVQDSKGAQIQSLAERLSTPVGKMLEANMHHILCHHLLEGRSMNHFSEFLTPFMEEGMEVNSLLLQASCELLLKLVIELGNTEEITRERALEGIRRLHCLSPAKNSDLSLYLAKESLALLAGIKKMLFHAATTTRQMIQVARALEKLFKLMGPRISSVSFQVMKILETFLLDPQGYEAGLQAWQAFVEVLENRSLSALLPQITLALLPPENAPRHSHFHSHSHSRSDPAQVPKVVIAIFSAIHQRADKLSNLDNLFFIQRRPYLESLYLAVNKKLDQLQFRDKLDLYLRGLENDALLVAEQALLKIRELIAANAADIKVMVLSEAGDAHINRLVQKLLAGVVRFPPGSVRLLCCICLGELGAIDPDFLDLATERSAQAAPLLESREALVLFACTLIEEQLVPIMKATGSKNQDHVSYCIQQLLKFCNMDKNLEGGEGGEKPSQERKVRNSNMLPRELWKTFSADVREIASPFLSSGYVYLVTPERTEYPIFPTKTNVRSWARTFAIDLLARLPTFPGSDLFHAFLGIFYRNDHNLTLHLLRYLILIIITKGRPEDGAEIKCELNAVLRNQGAHRPPLTPVSTPVVAAAASSFSFTHPTTHSNLEMSEVCTQTIFEVVDFLNSWLRGRKLQEVEKKRTSSRDTMEDVKRVTELLGQIPHKLMAEAAVRVKASARALLHFEKYVRIERVKPLSPAKPSSSLSLPKRAMVGGSSSTAVELERTEQRSPQELSKLFEELQRIYSGLDEPDGMEGLASSISHNSLEQEILGHETAGRWAEAQTAYELTLSLAPSASSTIRSHVGLLTCLKNLGHLETILTHSFAAMSTYKGFPEDLKELNSFHVEAAWRLGKWDVLRNSLARPCLETRFEVRLGRLLQALHEGNSPEFSELLKKTRETLMVPLGAAAMESYTRAYPFIVQLQMLRELEAASSAWLGLEKPSLNHLVPELWDSQLELTSESFKVREAILSLRRIVLQEKAQLQAYQGVRSTFDREIK